jgi:hypothetical protein
MIYPNWDAIKSNRGRPCWELGAGSVLEEIKAMEEGMKGNNEEKNDLKIDGIIENCRNKCLDYDDALRWVGGILSKAVRTTGLAEGV